jgi:hypothetical protein
MPTQLERLVQETVDRSVASTFVRYVDHAAEEIAIDLLKNPAIKARFTVLVQVAIERALANLGGVSSDGD